MIYSINHPNQTCGYLLVTPCIHKHFVFKLIYFNSGKFEISVRVNTNNTRVITKILNQNSFGCVSSVRFEVLMMKSKMQALQNQTCN